MKPPFPPGMITPTDIFIVVFLIVMIGVALGVDAWLFQKFGERGTESERITYWSQRAPIIAAVLGGFAGMLAGHFWWPNHAWCQ